MVMYMTFRAHIHTTLSFSPLHLVKEKSKKKGKDLVPALLLGGNLPRRPSQPGKGFNTCDK